MSGPYWQAIVLLEELDGQHLKKRTLQQLGHCEATILLNHRGALSQASPLHGCTPCEDGKEGSGKELQAPVYIDHLKREML